MVERVPAPLGQRPGVDGQLSRSLARMENGHIESFNGKLRDKLLNQELPHAATGAGAAPTGGADRQSRPI